MSGSENSIGWNIRVIVRADGTFESKGKIKLEEYNKYRKKGKCKYFTLISGSIDNNRWQIGCKIQDNGTFNDRSIINLITSEEGKKFDKRNHLKHRTERLIKYKSYNQKNKEKCNLRSREHYRNHKEDYIRRQNRRKRELGFIPSNDSFVGAEGHHISKDLVIYIPKDLHRSVKHNIFTNEGMGNINGKALVWVGKNAS